MKLILYVQILLLYNFKYIPVDGSLGDNSFYYRKCLQRCHEFNCRPLAARRKNGPKSEKFEINRSVYLKYLGWDCSDECKYDCMWQTVEIFTEKEKRDVPQFHGKWPFIRFYGIQEPASALASVLNLLAHVYMLKKMRDSISYRAPFKPLWYLFGFVSVNTWIWSTIFHTRDFEFTEKMDYFSAFSLVLFQFNSFFIRVLALKRSLFSKIFMYSIILTSVVYYGYHVYFLSFVRFDYEYNMNVNILFGALNSACWIFWSLYKMFYENKRYTWRCLASVLLVDILMSFEIFDFSPIWWTVDSHALWHISTICIPFFWYQFIIDDNYQIDLANDYIR